MKGQVRFYAKIFGQFSKDKLTPERFNEIQNLFKHYDVIPNYVNEVRVSFNNKEKEVSQDVIQKIEMISRSHWFIIKINADHLSVESNPVINPHDRTVTIDNDSLFSCTKEIFRILLDYFDNKANRIALIYNYVNEDDVETIYRKHINPIIYFRDKSIQNWDFRNSIKEQKDILGVTETINIHVAIAKGQGNLKEVLNDESAIDFDGVIYTYDLNTIAENQEFRIDSQFTNEFYDFACSKMEEVISGEFA